MALETTEICTTVQWTVENISSLISDYEPGSAISSPVFQTLPHFSFAGQYCRPLYWRLKLYPNGADENVSDFISVFLRLERNNSIGSKVLVSFEICASNVHWSEDYEFPAGEEMGCKKFLEKQELLKDLENDQVTIKCRIELSKQKVTEPNLTISKDFSNLLSNEILTDFIISVNNKSFPCHKAILAARSPVFRAMFDSNMIEKQSGTMSIEDFDETTVQGLLEYVYSGTVQKLDKLAEPLLAAAEKYQMPNLKDLCQHSLLKMNITLENAASLLMLADLYNLTALKSKAVQFICDNNKNFIKTEGWLQLKKAPNLLGAELFETLTLGNKE